MATIVAFPNPDLTGILYSRYYEPEGDWDAVVYSHKFEDSGASFNSVNVNVPQTWELEFNGLTKVQAAIFDEHYSLAKGQLNDFPFTDKQGNLHTGVRYAPDGFKRSHDGHKAWIQSRKIKLIRRP